jgi:tRNA splicing ligase
MIKSEYGTVEVEGKGLEYILDLANILRCFNKRKIMTKDEILKLVDTAFKSDEEIHENFMKSKEKIAKMKEFLSHIEEMMDEDDTDSFDKMFGDLL